MRIIADLHIHSKYSRAVSPSMDLEHLDLWAGKKGISMMGTGDFTHPIWLGELQKKLEPAEPGLYILKKQYRVRLGEPTRFLLSAEISSIYKKNNKTRKIHNIIFSPSLETSEKINKQLSLRGNIHSDGRPILGLDSKELLKIVLNINPDCLVVPAHAWTPWFSIFGSMSGFDTIEECFDELTPHIKAIETGLSSDPAMNWRLSKLDGIALISNSDSHSPQKIGREANVFETELSYSGIIEAITLNHPNKFLFTVEFFPEEGRYHLDGHRLCNYSSLPEETKKNNLLCPICRRPTTVGVLHRVADLADRPPEFKKPGAVPFKSMIPLDEIIADMLCVGKSSKKVREFYEKMISVLGSEFSILMDLPFEEIEEAGGPLLKEAIRRVRAGQITVKGGYDGEYGVIKIFDPQEDMAKISNQESLF